MNGIFRYGTGANATRLEVGTSHKSRSVEKGHLRTASGGSSSSSRTNSAYERMLAKERSRQQQEQLLSRHQGHEPWHRENGAERKERFFNEKLQEHDEQGINSIKRRKHGTEVYTREHLFFFIRRTDSYENFFFSEAQSIDRFFSSRLFKCVLVCCSRPVSLELFNKATFTLEPRESRPY